MMIWNDQIDQYELWCTFSRSNLQTRKLYILTLSILTHLKGPKKPILVYPIETQRFSYFSIGSSVGRGMDG